MLEQLKQKIEDLETDKVKQEQQNELNKLLEEAQKLTTVEKAKEAGIGKLCLPKTNNFPGFIFLTFYLHSIPSNILIQLQYLRR